MLFNTNASFMKVVLVIYIFAAACVHARPQGLMGLFNSFLPPELSSKVSDGIKNFVPAGFAMENLTAMIPGDLKSMVPGDFNNLTSMVSGGLSGIGNNLKNMTALLPSGTMDKFSSLIPKDGDLSKLDIKSLSEMTGGMIQAGSADAATDQVEEETTTTPKPKKKKKKKKKKAKKSSKTADE